MRAFFARFVISAAFLMALLAGSAMAAVTEGGDVRVGLSYGSGALASANLENSVGSGYRFGYYDSQGRFTTLGSTGVTQISMLKTQNIYLNSDGTYTESVTGQGLVGCYHIQLPGAFSSFQDAQSKASGFSGGFPAWVNGTYYVRIGGYATQADAQNAKNSMGLSDGVVVGTTSYGISVTQTKTAKILFQYDNAGGEVFAVKPGTSGSDTQTWFKGNKYKGSFLYERIGGGNLTVMNLVTMEDYIKGLVTYEMSASWPIEALKAQAVCARSYVVSSTGTKHAANHFDICNTTCCQAYRGCGRATAYSDSAVDATAGIYARYNGQIAQTFYYASNGGATEDCANVWFADLPYLKGKLDPYEADVANSISGYYWTVTYTPDEITKRLRNRGYDCGNIVNMAVTQFTPSGNVYTVTFTDDTGKTYTASKEKARNTLGVKSMRFTISGGSGSSGGAYYVDGPSTSLTSLDGIWAVGSGGEKVQISGTSGLSVITSTGVSALQPASGGSASGVFTISGAGNGHNIGMSQWGAYAMANRGYTYEEILQFYFTGIDLY